jgi:hypothetical protein
LHENLTMKTLTFAVVLAAASLAGLAAHAQSSSGVWRCGNEYTNNPTDVQRKNCKPVSGGNVTVVQGNGMSLSRPVASMSAGAARPAGNDPRVSSAEQRQRDSDARAVLQAELQKAQARREELLKEYNNGQPDKQGSEAKNYQKYLDRVASMKADIDRNQSDIDGLQRELDRQQ